MAVTWCCLYAKGEPFPQVQLWPCWCCSFPSLFPTDFPLVSWDVAALTAFPPLFVCLLFPFFKPQAWLIVGLEG